MYEISLMCAVIGYVYAEILTDEGMILSKWKTFAELRFPRKIYMPVVGCHKCVVGQASLWAYLIDSWSDYSPLEHAYCVCLSILITVLIDKTVWK